MRVAIGCNKAQQMRNRVQSSVFAGTQQRAANEQRQQKEQQRGERSRLNQRMYQTSAWRALRASQLDAFPNCATPHCKAPATVVDHRVAHRGSNSLFHDPDNLQSLCKRCHDRKTVRYDGGFGRKRANESDDDDARGFGLV